MEWKKGDFGYSLRLPHGKAFINVCSISSKTEWSALKYATGPDAHHVRGTCFNLTEAKACAEAFLDTVRKTMEEPKKEK